MITVNSRADFLVALWAKLPIRPYVAEIGVYQGDFAERLLKALNPRQLLLFDPFEKNDDKYNGGLTTAYSTKEDRLKVLDRFADEIILGQVLVGTEYSYEAVKNIPDDTLNIVYHDASHKYFDIKRDLKEWLPKVKENGVIAGHDYLPHEDFGVIQAVNEFMEKHNFEMIIFNEQGGDYALKRK